MDSSLSKELAVRYLEGKCTIEEIREVERLLLLESNKSILHQVMSEHWGELNEETLHEHSMDHVLQNVHMYIGPASEHFVQHEKAAPVVSMPRAFFPIWKVAAAILLVVAAGVTLFYFNHTSSRIAAVFTNSEVKTLAGEMTTITLPDGTTVWLNANSSLRYDGDFPGEMRSVFLEGEAYFDVAHNPAKPFVVHVLDLDVKVLGTAFNVKSYSHDRAIETTLVRGKVVIEKYHSEDSSSLELAPNERAVYFKETRKIELTRVDAQAYTKWLKAPLIFEEKSLDEVIRSLERRYNVTIHTSDAQSMDCKLTAQIRDESLNEMLELLKSTTSITYKIEGSEVFIEGKMCD